MKNTTLTMLALALGATSLCAAGEVALTETAAAPAESFSFCKWLPSKFKWFDAKKDNAENPYIQSFAMTFRAQYQWGSVDPNGDHNNGRSSNNEFRRLRMGAKATVFEDYKVKMVWDIGGANAAFDEGVRERTEAGLDTLSVTRDVGNVSIKLGKFKPAFTGEYRISSSKIKTIERSAIVNQLTPGKTWGISFENADEDQALSWKLGTWAQGLREETMWQEPSFNSDTSALFGGSIGYATSKNSNLVFDYMHSFAETKKSAFIEPDGIKYDGCGARDVVSLAWTVTQDRLNVLTELIGGFNVDNNDQGAENVFGFVVLPTYKFNDNWEGVFRYQVSAGSNAAKIYKRYYTENSDYDKYSDLMQAFYFGVNYYICPSKPDMMKIMAGMEYVNSHGTNAKGEKGYNGWQFSTALRVNF